MQKRRARGAAVWLLLLVLFVVYIGYQVVANLSDSIKTVEAALVSVDEKAFAQGVFIRSQNVVEGIDGKYAIYLVNNGEKVAKGQQLAVYFDDAASMEAYKSAQLIGKEIESLTYTYNSMLSGADSIKLDSLISKNILEINNLLNDGNAAKTADGYSNLKQLVISRGAGGVSEADYRARLGELEAQKSRYLSQVGASSYTAVAETAGFFVYGSDGLETAFGTDRLDTLVPKDLDDIRSGEQDGALGSIIDEYVWYYACTVDRDTAELLKNRKEINLCFPQISSKIIKTSVYRISTYEEGPALLILKCGVMREEYLSLRTESAAVIIDSYSGLKVPQEALRQLEGEWGVYVLDGEVVKFKPVTWVYQTESYYLCTPAASPAKGIYMYDKVITSAKNLEAGKIIK